MIATIKAVWAEKSTKWALALLALVWAGRVAASILIDPAVWPQVAESIDWPIGLATTGALAAVLAPEKRPPCQDKGDAP